jgi:hypothetical protein
MYTLSDETEAVRRTTLVIRGCTRMALISMLLAVSEALVIS